MITNQTHDDKNDDDEEDEEILLCLDFEDFEDLDLTVKSAMEITNFFRKNPRCMVGGYMFDGSYKRTIGTQMFLELNSNDIKSKSEVKFVGLSLKRLAMDITAIQRTSNIPEDSVQNVVKES